METFIALMLMKMLCAAFKHMFLWLLCQFKTHQLLSFEWLCKPQLNPGVHSLVTPSSMSSGTPVHPSVSLMRSGTLLVVSNHLVLSLNSKVLPKAYRYLEHKYMNTFLVLVLCQIVDYSLYVEMLTI